MVGWLAGWKKSKNQNIYKSYLSPLQREKQGTQPLLSLPRQDANSSTLPQALLQKQLASLWCKKSQPFLRGWRGGIAAVVPGSLSWKNAVAAKPRKKLARWWVGGLALIQDESSLLSQGIRFAYSNHTLSSSFS